MNNYNKNNCKCKLCDKGMHRKPYELKSGKLLFCSKKCSDENKAKTNYNNMCERVGCDFEVWLNQKYNMENLNSRDLAEIAYGKRENGPNITNWMKKLGVPIRSRTDAVALQWKDNFERKVNQSIKINEVMGAGTDGRVRLTKIMQSEEYRTKQSVAKTGERNGMYGITGEKHPKWNSELTDEDRIDSRKYPEYDSWRRKVFERDDYTCQRCKCRTGGNLNAHHINGYHWDENSRIEVDNGITLCNDCHKEFHKLYGYGNNDLFQFSQYMYGITT